MRQVRTALMLFLVLSILVGGLYPAAVTAVAALAFPAQAEGSLVRDGSGKVMGSELIGQPFSAPKYFWPRPSATQGFPYNPMASGGSQLGPTNPELGTQMRERVQALRAAGVEGTIPSDLVTSSGSGLDPDISPEAAFIQVARVAKSRGMTAEALRAIVSVHIKKRFLGFIGAPRVNVLSLNIDLDAMEARTHGEQ
jgi:potassium-transporting ATPase KdpC subunit